MILSIDGEKAYNKIQNPFIIKTLSKLGIPGKFLNLMGHRHKTSANTILHSERLFSPLL